MNKEQLQFFYDEIMGMFGWDDGDEASGVDPLLWAKKEIFLLRDNLRNYKAQVYMTDADNIKLRAELESVTNQMEEQAARFERGCYKQDEDGEVWDMCPVMEMANKQISQKDAELAAKTKAVDEARGVIYELLGVLPDSKHIDDCWNWAWEELNDAGQEAVIDKRKFADNWLTSHPEGKEE